GFLKASEGKAFDLKHRNTINFNIGKYNVAVEKGLQNFSNLALARNRANHIKWAAIEKLEQYLLQFETNFQSNGGKVLWAQNGEEAIKEILHIFKKVEGRSLVKSKSMVTEEIH